MPKAVKIVAFVAGGLLVLLVAFGVVLTLVFDPNDYKEQIVAAVKDRTGRTLQINGKLGWSFFPWIGIETNRLVLGNAPGFGTEPFARIEAAGAKVELLPLLRKQVVVDTVLLDGLQLHLARNAAGRTNWDDLIRTSPDEKTTPDGAGAGLGILVNGVDVRRAEIVWDDQASGARYALRNLDLKTGKIAGAEPMKVRLAFDLESGRPVVRTRVELTSTLRTDLDAQTLETSDIALSVGELKLRSQLKVTRLVDAPAVQGQLDIAPFNLRALLTTLNVSYAPADKKALERVTVKSAFSGNADGIEFKDLVVGLDDSRLTGTLAMTRFAKPMFRFGLALDRLDADRYLPATAPAAAAWPGIGVAVAAAPTDEALLGTLRALTLNGRLRIGQLTAMKLRFNDATVQVAAANGLIRLGPNQAGFYGGRYRGQTTLDARGRQAQLTLDDALSGAQLAPALKDALTFDKFTGTADVNAKLNAQGLNARQIKQTLSGNASLSIRDGTIKGLDLKKMIDALDAARRERRLENLADLKPGANDQTRFTHLSGTTAITNGVARNDDLKIQSPGVANIGGKGTIDLAGETLDYTVTAGPYPIHITGPFSNLRFRPDMRGVVEQRLKEEESKVKKRLEDKLKERFKLP